VQRQSTFSLINFSLGFFVVALIFYILYIGKSIFIPFIIALAIGYFIITLVEGIQNLSFRSWHLPKPVAYLLAIAILIALFWMFLNMLIVNVSNLVQSAPEYQQKFIALTKKILEIFNIKQPPDFSKFFEGIDFVSWGSSILFMLTDFAGSFGIILVYVLFILLENIHFSNKLDALFKDEKNRDTTERILKKVSNQIQSYVRIKTLISFFTAFLSYIVLAAADVDFAVFWAFLIFFLNFIPLIGSIVATIFPSLLTLLQFGDPVRFAAVTLTLVAIQIVVGNFIEPRVMGKSFNMSCLVILLSLALWGAIWGIIGMFLCVPITVIGAIVLANFETTRPIAVLLSEDGSLN
jgi:predicted PurR-regulated permease PerM